MKWRPTDGIVDDRTDPLLALVRDMFRSRPDGRDVLITPSQLKARLSEPEVACRVTDSSLLALSDLIDWLLARLSPDVPSGDSEEMRVGLLVGGPPWVSQLMEITTLCKVGWHAARLHGSHLAQAAVAYSCAQAFDRVGMRRVAVALLGRTRVAARAGNDVRHLVGASLALGRVYADRGLEGSAWRCLAEALALEERVPPAIRAELLTSAAECLTALQRHTDAAAVYRRLAELPESSQREPRSSFREAGTGRALVMNRKQEAILAARGLEELGNGLGVFASDYCALRPDGPVIREVPTPTGLRWYSVSSLHELFDRLEFEARRVLATRSSLAGRSSSIEFMRGWAPFMECLVETALAAGLPHRALYWCERFRASVLHRRMALLLGPQPEGVSIETWRELQTLLDLYRDAIEEEQPDDRQERVYLGPGAEDLEVAIRAKSDAIRHSGARIPESLKYLDPPRRLPTAEDLVGIPPRSVIAEFFVGASAGGAWIIDPVDPGSPSWVPLPELSTGSVAMAVKKVRMAAAGCDEVRGARDDVRARGRGLQAASDAIASAVNFVRKAILDPLLDRQRAPLDHLVVVPHGGLHVLPFHAAVESDRQTVSYAPSLTSLISGSRPRPVLRSDSRVVVAADSVAACESGHVCFWPLPGARFEAESLKKFVEERGMLCDFATGATISADWIERKLASARLAHIAVHCVFDANDPSGSGLLLSPPRDEGCVDQRDLLPLDHSGRAAKDSQTPFSLCWTVRRAWRTARLERCELVFLAGCQSSLSDWDDALEEFLSLPGALLQAGARTVVGSMWNVADLPAALLVREFYRALIDEGSRPSAALNRAQQAIRATTRHDLINQERETIESYYCSEFGTPPQSTQHALVAILGEALASTERPFDDPLFWGAFRCIGAA